MALLYEFMNEERNFGMTKILVLLEGETDQEFCRIYRFAWITARL